MESADDGSAEVRLGTCPMHISPHASSSSALSQLPVDLSTVLPLFNFCWPTSADWFNPDAYLSAQPHAFWPPPSFSTTQWLGTAAIGSPLTQHFILALAAACTSTQADPMLVLTVEYVCALELRQTDIKGLCNGSASDLVAVLSRLQELPRARCVRRVQPPTKVLPLRDWLLAWGLG